MRLKKFFTRVVLLFFSGFLLIFVYVKETGPDCYFCITSGGNEFPRFVRTIDDREDTSQTRDLIVQSEVVQQIVQLSEHRRTQTTQRNGEITNGRPTSMSTVWMSELALTHTQETVPNKFKPQWWKNHTETMCRELGMNSNFSRVPLHALAKIIVDDRHKILYCQIAKVASTNMGKIFAILVGLFNNSNPNLIPSSEVHYKYNNMHLHLNTLPLNQVLHRVNSYYKMMFVRDPFERLLSAFRNKFLKPPSNFFAYLDRKLVQVYRTNLSATGGVTFEEFVRYLVDPTKRIPTNPHWQPFHELCRPCEMKYDIIGKLATFNEDTRHILEKNNLTELVHFPKIPDSSQSLHNTGRFLKKYYSAVPKDLLQKLYKVYYPDYAIFDFTVPSVIIELLK